MAPLSTKKPFPPLVIMNLRPETVSFDFRSYSTQTDYVNSDQIWSIHTGVCFAARLNVESRLKKHRSLIRVRRGSYVIALHLVILQCKYIDPWIRLRVYVECGKFCDVHDWSIPIKLAPARNVGLEPRLARFLCSLCHCWQLQSTMLYCMILLRRMM